MNIGGRKFIQELFMNSENQTVSRSHVTVPTSDETNI